MLHDISTDKGKCLSVLILIFPIIFYQLQNLIIIAPEYLNEAENFIKEINNKYLLSEKIKAIDYTSFFKPLSNNLLNSGNHLINNGIEFFSNVTNYNSIDNDLIKKYAPNVVEGVSKLSNWAKNL